MSDNSKKPLAIIAEEINLDDDDDVSFIEYVPAKSTKSAGVQNDMGAKPILKLVVPAKKPSPINPEDLNFDDDDDDDDSIEYFPANTTKPAGEQNDIDMDALSDSLSQASLNDKGQEVEMDNRMFSYFIIYGTYLGSLERHCNSKESKTESAQPRTFWRYH